MLKTVFKNLLRCTFTAGYQFLEQKTVNNGMLLHNIPENHLQFFLVQQCIEAF